MGLVAMVTHRTDCVIVVAMVTHCRDCIIQLSQSPTLVDVSDILCHCVNLSEKMENFINGNSSWIELREVQPLDRIRR